MTLQFPGVLEIPFSEKTYQIELLKGKYLLEAYGASGGGDSSRTTSARDPAADSCLYTDAQVESDFQGNAKCKTAYSQPGAGGYVRGKLFLRRDTTIFVTTGGQGKFGIGTVAGGHNGGGNGIGTDSQRKGGSGGGATDFRVLKNSLFNRFLVAGAGGGTDDAYPNEDSLNDGSGGSGGLPGQGMWAAGVYKSDYETNTTYGYSFGYGQNTKCTGQSDCGGAGSGFFGGFAEKLGANGGSAGSSFALTEDAEIPTEKITVLDSSGAEKEEGYYALTNRREFYLTDVVFATGVWIGDGKARITFLEPFCGITCDRTRSKTSIIIVSLLLTIIHNPFSHSKTQSQTK